MCILGWIGERREEERDGGCCILGWWGERDRERCIY